MQQELDLLKSLGCDIIAGNYARGLYFKDLHLPAEDIDIFTFSQDEFLSLKERMPFLNPKETKYSITYDHRNLLRPIQLIKPTILTNNLRFLKLDLNRTIPEGPESLIQTFDFGICQVAYSIKKDTFYVTEYAKRDNKYKHLYFINTNKTQLTYKRFFKYIQKGLDPCHPITINSLKNILFHDSKYINY